ncbi:MAG: biopolymer transporter ExbD [candidate division WOR-3 bacterium]
MKFFKQRKNYEIGFDFVSISMANLAFIVLAFLILSIPKKEKGILFAFEEKEQLESPSNYVRFSINDKGEFFIEDENLSYDKLLEKLKAYLSEDSTRSIYLIIHRNATYEYFIKAFDIANETFKTLKLSPKIFIGVIKR